MWTQALILQRGLSLTLKIPHDDIEVSDDDLDCPNSTAEENYAPDDNNSGPLWGTYPSQMIKVKYWNQD